LAQAIWEKKTGVIMPKNLFSLFHDRFDFETQNYTPQDALDYMLELLDTETAEPGEVTSDRLYDILGCSYEVDAY
jgi:hypothetical protein